MTDWIKACSTDNLGQGEMFSFDHNEKKLLLTNSFNSPKLSSIKLLPLKSCRR